MGILLDPISVMMLVVISTVSLMVHVYSLGYMKGERGFQRYYAFLSLFTMSMMGLVVATNIFQMYLFWELVGVSSYLLIGFYYTKEGGPSPRRRRPLFVTRFADLGFLVGILFYGYYAGTFSFTPEVQLLAAAGTMIPLALGLMFIGGAGQERMFPLHICCRRHGRPDAVSALIHAATMVVAGRLPRGAHVPALYRLCARSAPLDGLHRCLYGTVRRRGGLRPKRYQARAGVQHHFADRFYDRGAGRQHLGRSACGRLGYMASMFHLFTHAMFKALLFLGAGCIIHAVHSNEMSSMGGLRKYMPVTHATFLVACLAIAGIWPLSGFFSKDEILTACFAFSPAMGWLMHRHCRTDGVLHVPPVLQYLLGTREPGTACRAQTA